MGVYWHNPICCFDVGFCQLRGLAQLQHLLGHVVHFGVFEGPQFGVATIRTWSWRKVQICNQVPVVWLVCLWDYPNLPSRLPLWDGSITWPAAMGCLSLQQTNPCTRHVVVSDASGTWVVGHTMEFNSPGQTPCWQKHALQSESWSQWFCIWQCGRGGGHWTGVSVMQV